MARAQADQALQPTGGGEAHGPAVVLDAAAAAGGPVIVPGGEYLLHADYVRHGPDLMLVGHLPFLSCLASLLLVGDPERSVIRFRNSGIVCLVREQGNWFLGWTVIPEIV